MANTYYDSHLTAAEIEAALEAIDGVIVPANNGKVLAINNGKLEARSVQWGGGSAVLEPLSVTANGDYYPEAGVDGFDEVHVAVPSSSPTIQSLSVTQNGTYTVPSGVDGYSPVVVNVSGGGGSGNTILHETQYKTTSGGTFSYSKEVTITETGNYKITCCSWGNNLNVEINGVSQSVTLADSYFRLFYAEISLNANDTIIMSTSGGGKCAAIFVVTKI